MIKNILIDINMFFGVLSLLLVRGIFMINYLIYLVTGVFLLISVVKDKTKTKRALKKAWRSFENILPQFVGIILLVGIMLSFFNETFISSIIGESSGFLGVLISLLVGGITLIPGFIAFPTAALLLDNGAGIAQIAAFISSLMMVGVVTFPIETEYFGKKITIVRNTLAVVFSLIIALIMGVLL